MPLTKEDGPLREAAILTRAVENVFRKMIRLLIGRMSLPRLQEMIRIVFVEEAESKLRNERPGKTTSLTTLALLTGLDTRTLTRLIDEKSNKPPLHKENRFLRDITPESNVLDYWSTNLAYKDTKSGSPLILELRGEFPSFESLVEQVGTPRGVTTKSILERLVESESIELDNDRGTVTLLRNRYLALEDKGIAAALEIGFVTVGYLVDTIVHNLNKEGEKRELFFQRSNWTSRLDKTKLPQFRSELRRLLSEAELSAMEKLKDFDELEIMDNQITAGFSVFYFEEDPTEIF